VRPHLVTAIIAGFAAGLAATVLVVGIASGTGAFDSSQSTTRVMVRPSTIAPVTVTAGAGGFDPSAIYRDRIGGVVTISSVLGQGNEIGGSGFVVNGSGLILTNAHVVTNSATVANPVSVKRAQQVWVRFQDGNQVPAKIIGFDLFDDVALVQVSDPQVELAPVPLGNSNAVHVGEPVAAIGSPFLEAGSLSVGVVSAVNRAIPSSLTNYSIPGEIQTDAAINHGNSGGPLFNSAGQVIGINAQINTTSGGGEGVGFAVPIDAAKRSMQQLLATGKVSYGWLGIRLGDVTPTLASAFHLTVQHGALVESVSPGGPAAQAGVRGGTEDRTFQDQLVRPDGDIIVSVDGHPVADSDQFIKLIDNYSAGKVVHLLVQRGSTHVDIPVTLGERPLAPSS
jgi:S1-C subfamily serine protease